jgi:hypothetical protein
MTDKPDVTWKSPDSVARTGDMPGVRLEQYRQPGVIRLVEENPDGSENAVVMRYPTEALTVRDIIDCFVPGKYK